MLKQVTYSVSRAVVTVVWRVCKFGVHADRLGMLRRPKSGGSKHVSTSSMSSHRDTVVHLLAAGCCCTATEDGISNGRAMQLAFRNGSTPSCFDSPERYQTMWASTIA